MKFPLILRISNDACVKISFKGLFINKNKIKHYLIFFSRSKPRSVCFSTIFSIDKQNKANTLKEPSEKENYPIEMGNNCELFSTASNIAKQLKQCLIM